MTKYSMFSIALLGFTTINAETVKIINNTDMTLTMEFPIPEYTKAKLELTKLGVIDPQEMLHEAISKDSAEGITQAVLSGASVNQERNGKSPLLFAVLLKKSDATEALLTHGANAQISYAGKPLVNYALQMRDIKTVLLLVKLCGATVGINEVLNIFQNTYDGHMLIKELKNRGCFDINYLWLHHAFKNETGVWFLLENGANPNIVIDDNNIEYIRINKRTTCSNTWTPLLIAISQGSIANVKMLLEAGANVNQSANPFASGYGKFYKEKTGTQTPLSLAISLGRSEIIELLISHGA